MTPRILMIENDQDDRLLTEENFKAGWPEAAIEFISGAELVARLDQTDRRPQLILVTMNVRPLGGVEAVKWIRSRRAYDATPIIVLSESADPAEIDASYAAGASSFIQKPSGYEDSLAKIRAFIAYWARTVELPAGVDLVP